MYQAPTGVFAEVRSNGRAQGVHKTYIDGGGAGNETPRPSTHILRDARYATRIRAILYKGDSFQSTLIRDVSAGGVGLRGAIGVFAGDKVALQLLDGRRLEAVVRWWLAGCCGLAFTEPLGPDDKLLTR